MDWNIKSKKYTQDLILYIIYIEMFWQVWQMKEMYDKYKKLQDALKNLIIRARENWVLIDMSAEMEIKDVKIEDDSLMSLDNKTKLEEAFIAAYQKAKTKAQDIAMTKTKEILGFDPNDLMGMMWGGWGMPKIPGLN